jgi:hypothetical protein
MLISDKVDLKPKLVRRDKEDHFIIRNGTVNQEEITIVDIYIPNVGTSNFIKQKVLDFKAQIYPSTMIVGDFSILL